MQEKTIRRRRAVLALLVLLSLILISASFTSSGGGLLRSVQNGFLDIVSPIETGANKVLTPVHDLFGAIDDVVNASSQRDKLQRQLTAVRRQFIALQAQDRTNAQATAILGLLDRSGLRADGPVGAHTVIQPQSLFASTIQIDVGTGSGVHDGDPVINQDGLVGTVASVSSSTSVVDLINGGVTVAAMDNGNGEVGAISADPGSPTQLQLTNVRHPQMVHVGDFIVSAGSHQTGGASPLPPDIPIGQVTSVPAPGDDLAPFTVSPAADLGAIGVVTVLTKARA